MAATPTRVQVETYLFGPDLVTGRRGKVCARVPLYAPASVSLGSVPAAAGPISGALRFVGVEPADPTNPTNADLALIPAGYNLAVYEIADLLLLESVLGNWDRWDEQISMGVQKKGEFRKTLQTELTELRKHCRSMYGFGVSAPSLGRVDLGFAASEVCFPIAPCPPPTGQSP